MINSFTDPIANFLGPWALELNCPSLVLRIILSLLFASVIGWERSIKLHSAGFRTFILVSLAGTASMIIDICLASMFKTNLFLISAVSVLCSTIIATNSLFFSSRNQIKGLTTSVALWLTCIVGLTIGAGLYTITLAAFLGLIFCVSLLPPLEFYLKNKSNHFEVHLELKNSHNLQDFSATIRKLGMVIDAIESNPAYANSGLAVYSVAIRINSDELKKYKTHKEIIEALSTMDFVSFIEEI